jgi:Putative metallopeptidase
MARTPYHCDLICINLGYGERFKFPKKFWTIRRETMMTSQNVAALASALCVALTMAPRADAAQQSSGQIRVEYVPPKDLAHQPIYDEIRQAKVLERIQELLSPLQLTRPLLIKVTGCDGESNAWYDEDAITVCYEFLADILKNGTEQALPTGITPRDTIIGPLVDVFLHESGHAVFDLLKIPLFGREEDAADQFSAYIMLHFGKQDAHKLIEGSAYQYKADLQKWQGSTTITKFANVHGTPAQRFYNVLCIAYGADQTLFADVVQKGYLPADRADGCDGEYEQIAYAFKTLIGPHLDKALANKVLKTWMREVDAPQRRPPSR